MLKDREYLGTVSKMYLNTDYAAVMFDNRVQLHLVSYTPYLVCMINDTPVFSHFPRLK